MTTPTRVGADTSARLRARLVDGVLLGGLTQVVIRVALGDRRLPDLPTGQLLVVGFLTGLLPLAYYVVLETRGLPTLGKRLCRLTVVGPSGAPPTVSQSLRRNWFLLLGLLSWIPVLGVLVSLVALGSAFWVLASIRRSPVHQGLHDTLAGGTWVLRSQSTGDSRPLRTS